MENGGVAGRGGTVVVGGALAPTVPAVTLLILNLLDGLFTLTFLQIGVAEEANPIMRAAYEFSPLGFMVLKLAVVNLGVIVLSMYRGSKLADRSLKLAVAIYAVIVTWHLAFLAHLLTA